jgi:hypothetical protein
VLIAISTLWHVIHSRKYAVTCQDFISWHVDFGRDGRMRHATTWPQLTMAIHSQPHTRTITATINYSLILRCDEVASNVEAPDSYVGSPGSNTGPETSCSERCLSWFPSVPPRKCQDSKLYQAISVSFQIFLSHFSIMLSTIRCCSRSYWNRR